jgi:hypothetical protein
MWLLIAIAVFFSTFLGPISGFGFTTALHEPFADVCRSQSHGRLSKQGVTWETDGTDWCKTPLTFYQTT